MNGSGHMAMGRGDILWVLRVGGKKWYSFHVVLLGCSHLKPTSMLWGNTSHPCPMDRPIWGGTESHYRSGNSSSSQAAPADAEWGEMSRLHWTLSNLQIHKQKKWLSSFLRTKFWNSLRCSIGRLFFLICKKGIFLLPLSSPKPHHQHHEGNQAQLEMLLLLTKSPVILLGFGVDDKMPPPAANMIYGDWGSRGFICEHSLTSLFWKQNISKAWEASWSLWVIFPDNTYSTIILSFSLSLGFCHWCEEE